MKYPFLTNLRAGKALPFLVCLGLSLALPALANIGDAVDAPALTWTTGGAAPWSSQTVITHDGSDAAESGAITDTEETWIETTVTGPGTLVFWWKVSSEYDDIENVGYDSLEFFTNGVSPLQGISGKTDWEIGSLQLPAGTIVLQWSYIKDESDVFPIGQDRAWVDEVSLFTSAFAPIIADQPEDQAAPLGGTVVFSVSAIGTDPLSYQWQRDGTNLVSAGNISGAQSTNLTLSSITSNDLLGTYSAVITNAQGSATSAVASLSLAPTLAQAVDATGLVWTSGGDSPWYGQTNETHDGTDASQSGSIDDNESSPEQSWIQTSVNGPGELRFWWKVSSEDSFDILKLSTNGTLALQISGDSGWQEVSRLLGEGLHTLRWTYEKDETVSWRNDSAWLDQVYFGSPVPQPFWLLPSGFTGDAFQLTLQGEPTRIYRLYSSSNLLDWTPVQTNSDPSGMVPFTDSSVTGQPLRYYRAETDFN